MDNRQIKELFIQALYNRGEYIRQVNDVEYRTRCPFCGDSQKNFNTGHFYIRVGIDDNFPILYNCFKCSEHGVANQELLNAMDIDDIELKASLVSLNKTSDKVSAHRYLYGEKIIQFGYELPEIGICNKTKYIEERLGTVISLDDLRKMKVVTSLRDFLITNNIKKLQLDSSWCSAIEDHYVGFLSFGGSYILFRDITSYEKIKWIKYPITDESKQCKLFYSIQTEIDVLSYDKMTINLSEGVMDILSVYSNLEYNDNNTMNIAVGGKQYSSIIFTLVNMGLIGSNITLNIFSDNDEAFNTDSKNPTNIDFFKKLLNKSKNLFGSVNVYYNTISKDVGVPKNQISLKKYKI